jgi:hypothetical protein
MVAVFQVKRLTPLSRRRHSISDVCIRTDMALVLPNGALAGAAVDSQTISKTLVTSHKCISKWRFGIQKKRRSAPLSASFYPRSLSEKQVKVVKDLRRAAVERFFVFRGIPHFVPRGEIRKLLL